MSSLPLPNLTMDQKYAGNLQAYLLLLVNSMQSELNDRPTVNEPINSVLMYSPDRSIWQVTISNAGVLAATKVQNG